MAVQMQAEGGEAAAERQLSAAEMVGVTDCLDAFMLLHPYFVALPPPPLPPPLPAWQAALARLEVRDQ